MNAKIKEIPGEIVKVYAGFYDLCRVLEEKGISVSQVRSLKRSLHNLYKDKTKSNFERASTQIGMTQRDFDLRDKMKKYHLPQNGFFFDKGAEYALRDASNLVEESEIIDAFNKIPKYQIEWLKTS